MIRIDLLPSYVAAQRLTKNLRYAFAVLFLLIVIAFPLYYYLSLAPALTQANLDAASAEKTKADIDAVNAEATTVQNSIQPIKSKVDFVNAVDAYNASWVELYDKLARYTDPKIVYSSASVSGTNLSLTAYTPSIEEAGLFLEEMYKEPDIESVNIDHLPDYPDAVVDKYYLHGKLIAVGYLPGLTPVSPGMTGPGQFGQGMQQPQFNSPQRYNSGGPQGYGSGGTAGFGQSIDPEQQLDTPNGNIDDMVNAVVSPLAGPSQTVRLKALVRSQLLKEVLVKHQVRGFQVSVSATLKNGLQAPQVPAPSTATNTGATAGQFGQSPGSASTF